AYLAAHGTPTTARQLRGHRCLMGFARGELPGTYWTASGRKLLVEGVVFSNSQELLCRLAERGQGIAFVPSLAAQSRIASGELVAVMPSVLRSEGRIALVYPERELVAPQVRAFVDFMIARAPKVLEARRSAKPKKSGQAKR